MKQALRMCLPSCHSPDTKKCAMHEYTLDLSATDQAKVFRELNQQQNNLQYIVRRRRTGSMLVKQLLPVTSYSYLLAYVCLPVNSFRKTSL